MNLPHQLIDSLYDSPFLTDWHISNRVTMLPPPILAPRPIELAHAVSPVKSRVSCRCDSEGIEWDTDGCRLLELGFIHKGRPHWVSPQTDAVGDRYLPGL